MSPAIYLPRRDTPRAGALDFHETPAVATWALVGAEQLPRRLWEPACGKMAIARVLEAAEYDVASSDIVLRRCRAPRGPLARVDFLGARAPPPGFRGRGIVTNPPFALVDEFVDAALNASRYVAMLLPLTYLEGGVGPGRSAALRRLVLDERRPSRVWVFVRRLPMMHREGWTGRKAGSARAFAWFVWDRRPGGFSGETVVRRIDWHPIPTNRQVGKATAREEGLRRR